MDVYEIVTQRIMAMLENGTVPWQKPWSSKSGKPKNLVSNKEYNGINIYLLGSQNYECPYWLSFKQATERGGCVRKGEKGTPVVLWKIINSEDDDGSATSKVRKIPFLRYYNVFNASQCDGLVIPATQETVLNEYDPIDAASDIINFMPNPPLILHGKTQASYIPAIDTVHMPYMERFAKVEKYYATLFHEIVHSTMHPSRLNRKSDFASFGDTEYSKEELVAEMGCAYMSYVSGIEQHTIENSAAYINGWLQALKNDKKMVILAATQAQKAVDYILRKNISKNIEEEIFSEAA